MTIDLTAMFELCCDTRSDINGHLRYMHDVCIEIDAQVVLELGVRSGLSTVAFLHAMDRTNGHVWSVDIDRHHAPDEVRSHDRWTFTQADDLTVDPMPCDVLFIDTSHLYDHTLAELNRFASHARVVLLHDTQLERPAGAPAEPRFPVRQACLDWLADHPGWTWEEFEHCYGLGVMRKP